MPLHKIAVIGGDGIGPEVTREACIILSALQDRLPELKLEFTEFDWGSEYFLKKRKNDAGRWARTTETI